MTNFIKNFIADESGASAAEYALILVVVGLGIVFGAQYLSNAISDGICDTAGVIDTANTVTASANPGNC